MLRRGGLSTGLRELKCANAWKNKGEQGKFANILYPRGVFATVMFRRDDWSGREQLLLYCGSTFALIGLTDIGMAFANFCGK